MPYAVKCYPSKDAGVILCKDEDDLAEVNAEIVVGLKFTFIDAIRFGIESARWITSPAPVFQWFPVTIYRLTEEEYRCFVK